MLTVHEVSDAELAAASPEYAAHMQSAAYRARAAELAAQDATRRAIVNAAPKAGA